ncbi:hypothetical protein AOLI_G00117380 [Acnodon oligacanthus]
MTLTLTLLLSGAPPLSALQPENEVPLRPTAWLTDRTHTSVYLNSGRTRRLYFTVRKKTLSLELTVSPCSGAVEWSLTSRSLKDKPAKYTKCEGYHEQGPSQLLIYGQNWILPVEANFRH